MKLTTEEAQNLIEKLSEHIYDNEEDSALFIIQDYLSDESDYDLIERAKEYGIAIDITIPDGIINDGDE